MSIMLRFYQRFFSFSQLFICTICIDDYTVERAQFNFLRASLTIVRGALRQIVSWRCFMVDWSRSWIVAKRIWIFCLSFIFWAFKEIGIAAKRCVGGLEILLNTNRKRYLRNATVFNLLARPLTWDFGLTFGIPAVSETNRCRKFKFGL